MVALCRMLGAGPRHADRMLGGGPGRGMLTGCWGRGLADMQTHHRLTGQKKCSSFVSRLARRTNSSNGSVLGGERKDGGAETEREGTSHGWHKPANPAHH